MSKWLLYTVYLGAPSFWFLVGIGMAAESGSNFEFDGCTNFPDGPWLACCLLHDYIYWWQPDGVTRADADQAMRDCMESIGYPVVGAVTLAGVGTFGWLFWRRGRRGSRHTMPPMLRRWYARFKEKRTHP